MNPTIATQFAERFTRPGFADLPDPTRHSVKRLLLDYLGVSINGSQTESGTIARRFAALSGGHGDASLIGDARRVPAMQAAFSNAISAHSIELDDIDVLALFHFAPPVCSAALAAAEHVKASGEDLLVALAAGCELMERVSRAANPSLRNRGFHTTPTCGVFGATLAAALLYGLTPAQLISAFGLAGAQAGGLMEMYGPSMQKRFNPGPAARNGVTAAQIAQLGFSGADTIFEGERGFLAAFTDEANVEQLIDALDARYQLNIEFKPFSCARPIHNAIGCALEIRDKFAPDLDRVRTIKVARHPDWAGYHGNKAPQTYHEAQVSLPYSVAVALADGQALFAQYNDARLEDPSLRQLSNCVEITVDGSLPRGVSCRMSMEMDDGSAYVSQVDYPKGSIQNPMTDQELRGKFDDLSGPVLGRARASEIAALIDRLETCEDVTALMRLTMKAQ
ncbi:MmgE/PrpD family protein [Paraburkholderia caffeinilytica]|uniref:MmgE/PrpD family protein n=1 Tax=Paraburkholderia caffeinilytica TaxID=1761016 RepID=UPI0038B98860